MNGIGPGPTLQGVRQRPEHFAAQRAATVLERGSSPDRTALEAVGEEFSMPTAAIVDLDAIVARLGPNGGAPRPLSTAELERINSYRTEWGVRRASDATAP